MNNLVGDKKYAKILAKMEKMLMDKLVETNDSRIGTNPEIWETYPRLEGKMREFPSEPLFFTRLIRLLRFFYLGNFENLVKIPIQTNI